MGSRVVMLLLPRPVECLAGGQPLGDEGDGYHADEDAADEEVIKVLLQDIKHL